MRARLCTQTVLSICEVQFVPTEHLFCFPQHQPLRKFPADPLCVPQSEASPARLQTAFQQGTLSKPKMGFISVLLLAFSTGDGRGQSWVVGMEEGARAPCGGGAAWFWGPWILQQTVQNEPASVCPGSPRGLACQSAGRLSTYFSISISGAQWAGLVVGVTVMLPHERKASNPCDVEIRNGLWGSFLSLILCPHVVIEHLFPARLWASPWALSGGQETPALTLPSPLLRPCCVSHLDYGKAEQARDETGRPRNQTPGLALSSATSLPGDFGQETFLLYASVFSSIRWGLSYYLDYAVVMEFVRLVSVKRLEQGPGPGNYIIE